MFPVPQSEGRKFRSQYSLTSRQVKKALASDPVNVFGGIVAFNPPVERAIVEGHVHLHDGARPDLFLDTLSEAMNPPAMPSRRAT